MFGTIRAVVCVSFLALAYGCVGPELAQSPYTPIEREWESYLKQSYPRWNPPKTVPPASTFPDFEGPARAPQAGHARPAPGAGAVAPTAELPPMDAYPFEMLAPEPVEAQPFIGETLIVPVDPAPAITAPPPGSGYHVVRKGDTLWRIAAEHYGKGAQWKSIYDANREVLPDPSKLKVGMELVIPPQ